MKYERTGEFRRPRKGEWFESEDAGKPTLWDSQFFVAKELWILKATEEKPVSCWEETGLKFVVRPDADGPPWGSKGVNVTLANHISRCDAHVSVQTLKRLRDTIQEMLDSLEAP